MKNLNYTLAALILLAAMSTVPEAFAQSTPPPTSSVKSSLNSVTDASKAIKACMAVAVELEKSRVLIDALETEKRVVAERLDTERKTTALLTELAVTRKSESDALRTAIDAKNETIAAKDNVIAEQDKLNAALRSKRPSLLRRIGDILAGAAIVRMSNGFSREPQITPEDLTHTIWNRNRMATRAGTVHKVALVSGNAYLFVWPDTLGRAVFYPNRASQVAVKYDDDDQGRVLWAAKLWTDAAGRIRLNIFYPDRIDRFAAKGKGGATPEAKEMQPYADSTHRESAIANPYGIVPVFHFANNADLGSLGRSEIEAAMPVQDGLNKSVLDMLVAMEFSAFRQRWAAGIEVDYDAEGRAIAPFESGVEHLWIAGNPNARFGDFDAARLDQFLKVKDSFRIDMASVTGTPLHYFLQHNAGLPSGEALKKSETRFIAKIRDRQESFGQVWSDAMSFALRIEGREGSELITQWEDPSPVSEREFLENILLKRQIGLPVNDALREAGYGTADVERMSEPQTVATGSTLSSGSLS